MEKSTTTKKLQREGKSFHGETNRPKSMEKMLSVWQHIQARIIGLFNDSVTSIG